MICNRAAALLGALLLAGSVMAQEPDNRLIIEKTPDFEITGTGSAKAWNNTNWLTLSPYKVPGDTMYAKVKALYSDSGLYFLFLCEDRKITSTMKADFLDLWKEDVVEVFLQPDTSISSYLEYEVSPHNFELPILIANVKGSLRRWMPFHYESDRKTRHKTNIAYRKSSGTNAVESWTAEFFIPYTLFSPLKSSIPKPGERWKGNFYRVDYDKDKYSSWVWQRTRANFHDMERFGILEFR